MQPRTSRAGSCGRATGALLWLCLIAWPALHVGLQSPLAAAPEAGLPRAHAPGKTGVVYDAVFLRHDTGPRHPERPERLEAIVNRLRARELGSLLPDATARTDTIEWILTIHERAYIDRVRRSCREGLPFLDSPDTPVCAESYEVAVAAVAGVLSAVDTVVRGEARNAFCVVRPPGHHALAGRAMGFCLFNNVAVAARYAQRRHNLAKILIVDWDVHHGNGTQRAFYEDPTVLYFGVHQHPFYPGTGSADERGAGGGEGYTINVPLPAGSGDAEFIAALRDKLRPAALAFEPDLVLISAGFDAHKDDPIGGMNVTADGFAELTRTVKGIADTCCEGRIVSVLEGGYDLEGLADSAEAHVKALME